MRSRWAFIATATLCCAVSIVVAFRPFVFSGFDLVSGGPGDTRLLVVILEHWLAVFTGHAAFTSPSFFFPARHVLGYSDALLLYVPPYALARVIGFDRYLAFETTLIALKAMGFAAMVIWLRRTLGVSRPLSLLGGVLFAVSQTYYVSIGHGQLAAMAFLPVLALLGDAYWRHRRAGRTTRARVVIASAGMLLGLLLFTAYYVGWFAMFVGGTVGVVALPWVVSAIRRVGPTAVLADTAVGVAALGVALLPFAIVYVPVLRGTGGRSFTEVALYTAWVRDVVNVGSENLVWSAFLSPILPESDGRFLFAHYEAQRGWPPLLLLLFLATAGAAAWQTLRRGGMPADRPSVRVTAVLGAAAVVAWASSVQIAGVTPWALVFRLVPGAAAIRVPVRINLAINVLVIAVTMVGLDRLATRVARRRPRATALGFGVLALALVAEQLNTANPFHLGRAHERAVLARIPPLPVSCRAFYVVRAPTSDPMETIDTQTLMMLVSLDAGVPTINGYSGNVPRGWRLASFDVDYPKHVVGWIAYHRLARGMCYLDLERAEWSQISPPRRGAGAAATGL